MPAGEAVRLSAAGSGDLDGDRLFCRWWVDSEAGTYRESISVTTEGSLESRFTIPPSASGDQIYVIPEPTDDGVPPLTAYRRVVISAP